MNARHYSLAAVLVLSLTSVALAGFPAGDFVTELDDKLFESAVKGRPKDGFYLVEFYSPTCGHCRAFAPIYEEIGDSLRSIIPVGRLSVHDYREITTQYKVKGVPHVALFLPQNDNPIVYQDEKNVKDIIEWVLGAMLEFEVPLKEIKANEVDAFLNVRKKIYPSRYLLISEAATKAQWDAIRNRVGTKAILAHLDSRVFDLSKLHFNISRLPAVVAHMKSKEGDAADAPIDIITFQGSNMMSEIQKAMRKEKAFGDGDSPVKDDVSTEGLFKSDLDTNQNYDTSTIVLGACALIVCACGGIVWFYKNRNKKFKEVVPVNLEGVTWEVGGKKALD